MTNQNYATVVQRLCLQRQAALATVAADGAPHVGMVAFAVEPDGSALLLHLSTLAAHTRHLLAEPRVSLLLADPDSPEVDDVQTLARMTIYGHALPLALDDARYTACRSAYLRRFAAAEMRFGFADFVLVRVVIDQARFVGGFAQARTLTQMQVVDLLAQSAH